MCRWLAYTGEPLQPSTLVLDREGKIAARSLAALSEEKLRSMIDPVLAEK